MALNAAKKLDDALHPDPRTADVSNTARLFRFIFGHDPTLPGRIQAPDEFDDACGG
jgi:hypothetical protein